MGFSGQGFVDLAAVVDPVGPLEVAWLDVDDQSAIEEQRLVFLDAYSSITCRPVQIQLPFLYLNFRPIHLIS